jgi:hypothetical protein
MGRTAYFSGGIARGLGHFPDRKIVSIAPNLAHNFVNSITYKNFSAEPQRTPKNYFE